MKGKAGDALTEALSYLPQGGPAVVEITTDPGSPAVNRALGLANRFPGSSLLLGQLGDAVIATDTKLFAVRVKAKDAAVLRSAIARLTPVVPVFLQGAGLPGLRLGAARAA
ncbi:MAG: hypothetical protein JWN32_724 [Solirubrobacterales bacterium]|nr:hypothetical protein [Solirubrobacterales bacterium]